MRRTLKALRENGSAVATSAIDLHLGQIDRTVEIGPAKVRVAHIDSEDVALRHAHSGEISGNRDAAANGGSTKVRSCKLRPHEIASRNEHPFSDTVRAVREARAGNLAGLDQKITNGIVFGVNVESRELLRSLVAEPSNSLERRHPWRRIATRFDESNSFIEIPQQFVEPSDDGERGEHRSTRRRILSPGTTAECALGDLLPGSEAIEHGAALEPAVTQMRMDLTAILAIEIHAWLTRRLVEREISRLCKRQRDTAQTKAVRAIRPEILAAAQLNSCPTPHPHNRTGRAKPI